MNNPDNQDPQIADLRAVLALIEDGTVTRAAQRLGLTQSALSYHLDRMRKRFADPLFVRVGNRMAPTPFAQRLAEPASRVLRIVETEIAGLARFDPALTDREFRIGVNEIGAIVLVPKLMKRLAEVAPHARLAPTQVSADTMAAALESGELDVVAGHVSRPHDALLRQHLYRRAYVCVARRDHPRIGDAMTLREFGRTPQVQSPSVPITFAWINDQLRKHGVQSQVRLTTEHVAAIPFIVAASDLIAIIPDEVYHLFQPIAPIKKVRLPLRIPSIDVHQYWHSRVAGDPANQFFRSVVYAVGCERQPASPGHLSYT
ncbi:LysR family transcriptional regulator [Pigmentiphaga sp. H8]|uniref:LysR family transcriptional regulator n=1 Tax=unclassified Pigmentiphaga TaxID=2626614 RepID=UPI000F5A5651|nr:LysR family transcriptional regulator [Pigmentiphaga sp. H8]AZG09321.1 LysR family transcriptional regulator [Pigmentiphaga sp. H8]